MGAQGAPQSPGLHQGANTIFSYEFTQRLHDARVYPIQAPNGSTIIVYGYDWGLAVIWRDGERLDEETTNAKGASSTVNPNRYDILVDEKKDGEYYEIIPSDEELEDETNQSPSIVKESNFVFGASTLGFTFPPLARDSALQGYPSLPTFVRKSLIIAAFSSDHKVRLITVALDPAKRSYQVASFSLQAIPEAIAVTLARRPQPSTEDPEGFDFLIASCASERLPKVHFTRIPLEMTSKKLQKPQTFNEECFVSSITAVAFNSAVLSTDRGSQVLIADRDGCVQIYDPLLTPSDNDAPDNIGPWLAKFYSPFESPKAIDINTPTTVRRKPILDASWTFQGRSIIALLSDGEWGIWDLYGGGPGDASANVSRRQYFAVHGYIGENVPASVESGVSGPKKPRGSRSSLAPMTPNTRRQKQESLFSGPMNTASTAPSGGVTVQQVPSASGAGIEDAVTFWYDNCAYAIPSLRRFWSRLSQEKTDSGGGSLYGPGLSRIEGLDLHGERIQRVSQLPSETSSSHTAQKDYIVVTEHRLTFLTNELPRPSARQLFKGFESADASTADQSLLAHGELDIGGLESMLDSMNGNDDVFMGGNLNGTFRPRRVGFVP